MKKVFIGIVLVAWAMTLSAQTKLSPEERRSLIEELKKEILDSLRKNPSVVSASTDSIKEDKQKPWKGTVELSAYVEAYYMYDFNREPNGERGQFIYSHNRNNEFNVNLAFVKAAYAAQRIRANVALMAGTYPNANYTAEPGSLKNIFEANGGINLSKNKQLWLDAGIFASHIGFESAIAKDCWTLTRSMQADNSPYYETGAKLTYSSDNGRFMASALVLNGWQRIQKLKGNSLPAFGWQVQGKPNDKILINSSSFVGTDSPDSVRRMRYFHDLYMIINATDKVGFTLGLDVGAEQTSKSSNEYNYWYSPLFIARYQPIEKVALAARVEYYSDAGQVLITTGTEHGFQTMGYSLNVDVMPIANVMIRFQGHLFQSLKDDVFNSNHGFKSLDPGVGVSFAYSFAHQFK